MNLSRFVSIAALALAAPAFADNLTVQATADIYTAGQAGLPSTPHPGGFAPSLSFLAGANPMVTFSVSTSSLACDFSVAFTADGGCSGSNTQISSITGLSGITVNGSDMFLAGVFLDNLQPFAPAPADLQYNTVDPSSLTTGDVTFAPQIGQVFFIGDGFTGTGAGQAQVFAVPTSATRLYLGFTGNGAGAPIFDAHDTGSLSVTFTPVMEPSTLSLLAGALLALTARLIRYSRHG